MCWPPRSPNLTPPDFFSWAYLKQKVCASNVDHNMETLQNDTIRNAVAEINADTLKNIYKEFNIRVEKCFDRGGTYFQ